MNSFLKWQSLSISPFMSNMFMCSNINFPWCKNRFNEFWLWQEKNQYHVSNDIFQIFGACYVSPVPSAISKSPATKLNDCTSAIWSFLKKRCLQLLLSLEDIVDFLNFLFSPAELLLLLQIVLDVIFLFFLNTLSRLLIKLGHIIRAVTNHLSTNASPSKL